MAQNIIVVQEHTFESEEFDFAILEPPQLVRRNGTISNNEEDIGYILDQPIDKIFEQEQCPVCLESQHQLFPLKCGHTYCQYDIEKMIDISKSFGNLLKCPICRAYSTLNSFDEVSNFKRKNQENDNQLCY